MDKHNISGEVVHELHVEIIYHHGEKDIDFSCDHGTEIKINGIIYYEGDEYHDDMYARVEDVKQMCEFLLKHKIIHNYTISETKLNDEPDWD